MLGDRSRMKGFLHAVEGIIAAMLLFTYSYSFFETPPPQHEWVHASLSQEGRELLEVMKLAKVPAGDVEIYTRSASKIETISLLDLVILNRKERFMGIVEQLLPQRRGIALTTQGLLLPTIDVGVVNTTPDDFFRIRGNITKNIFGAVSVVNLNGRQTFINFVPTTLDDSWDDYEVLVIHNQSPSDLQAHKQKLYQYLQSGRGIVLLQNLSQADLSSYDVFENVFGLYWNDTLSSPVSNSNATINEIPPYYDSYEFYKYYYYIPLEVNTEKEDAINTSEAYHNKPAAEVYVHLGDTPYWLGTAACNYNTNSYPPWVENCSPGGWRNGINYDKPFDLSKIINSTNGNYHYGFVTLRRKTYGVLVVNSSGRYYDRVYIDADRDYKFRERDPLQEPYEDLPEGANFTIEGNTLVVNRIDPRGTFVRFLLIPRYYLHNMTDSSIKVYTTYKNEKIGPLAPDSSRFVLAHQQSTSKPFLPVAITNYKPFAGVTVWMPDNIKSDDEWHLVKSAILFVSSKKHEFIPVTGYTPVAANVKKVMVSDYNFFQPYSIFLRVWAK